MPKPKTRSVQLVLRKPKAPAKRRKRRTAFLGPRPRRSSLVHPLTQYIDCLSDPWNCPPCRLGWGNYGQSQLATAYLTQTFTVNGDGTFAVYLAPQLGATVNAGYALNISGATGNSWNQYQFSNLGAILSVAETARVISGGIKVKPLVAMTGSPGVLYAGPLPGVPVSTVNTLTCTQLLQTSMTRAGYGAAGAACVILPRGPAAFDFSINVISNVGYGTAPPPQDIIFITGAGFAGGTAVVAEIALNLEYLNNPFNSGTLVRSGDLAAQAPTMVEYGITPDVALMTARRAIRFVANVFDGAAMMPRYNVATSATGGLRALPGTASSAALINHTSPAEFASRHPQPIRMPRDNYNGFSLEP